MFESLDISGGNEWERTVDGGGSNSDIFRLRGRLTDDDTQLQSDLWHTETDKRCEARELCVRHETSCV